MDAATKSLLAETADNDYAYLRELTGEEYDTEIADCEETLAERYLEKLYTAQVLYDDAESDESDEFVIALDRLNAECKQSLAAIHNVSDDRVITNGDGSVSVNKPDGMIVTYTDDFERMV